MGYFSNGTEGEMYQEEYCNRCVHDKNNDCPILLLHLLWNYDQLKKSKEADIMHQALSTFIPEKKIGNEQCKMFIADEEQR